MDLLEQDTVKILHIAMICAYVWMCVCAGHDWAMHNSEPIKMPFGMLNHDGPKNCVLEDGPDPSTGMANFRDDVGIYPHANQQYSSGHGCKGFPARWVPDDQRSHSPTANAVGCHIIFSPLKIGVPCDVGWPLRRLWSKIFDHLFFDMMTVINNSACTTWRCTLFYLSLSDIKILK